MYRQGDILLIPVNVDDSMQRNRMETADPLGTNIIERGELTGHAHVMDEKATLYGFNEVPQWVVVDEGGSELTHEEHDTIVIPEGTYRIQRQREFDGTAARFVSD